MLIKTRTQNVLHDKICHVLWKQSLSGFCGPDKVNSCIFVCIYHFLAPVTGCNIILIFRDISFQASTAIHVNFWWVVGRYILQFDIFFGEFSDCQYLPGIQRGIIRHALDSPGKCTPGTIGSHIQILYHQCFHLTTDHLLTHPVADFVNYFVVWD